MKNACGVKNTVVNFHAELDKKDSTHWDKVLFTKNFTPLVAIVSLFCSFL
jgi:hypothetical protein